MNCPKGTECKYFLRSKKKNSKMRYNLGIPHKHILETDSMDDKVLFAEYIEY